MVYLTIHSIVGSRKFSNYIGNHLIRVMKSGMRGGKNTKHRDVTQSDSQERFFWGSNVEAESQPLTKQSWLMGSIPSEGSSFCKALKAKKKKSSLYTEKYLESGEKSGKWQKRSWWGSVSRSVIGWTVSPHRFTCWSLTSYTLECDYLEIRPAER